MQLKDMSRPAFPAKVHIGNSEFSACGFPETLEIMRREIELKQRRSYAAVVNIHVMVLMEKDPMVARIIGNADVCFCDSVSVVKFGRRQGKVIPRCYGPDYVLTCCEWGRQYGWRHFFLGGSEGVAEQMATRLTEKFPGMACVGTFCPPFREMTGAEIDDMIRAINEAKPDIIWVGLGAGKQDKWIDTYKERIQATWFSGVGAAFDFISGNTKRAPVFWQKLGMEWLYRFAFEPRRLFFRNLEGVALLLRLYSRQYAGMFSKSNRS